MGVLVMGFGHERTVMIGHQAGRCSAEAAIALGSSEGTVKEIRHQRQHHVQGESPFLDFYVAMRPTCARGIPPKEQPYPFLPEKWAR